jgi:hypothetical protein
MPTDPPVCVTLDLGLLNDLLVVCGTFDISDLEV